MCIKNKNRLCWNIVCVPCFDKSLASYKGKTNKGKLKIECWSEKNELKPWQVPLKSNQKYLFDCDECQHTFESTISNMTKDVWYPYCTNMKLCGKKECKLCFDKSLASYDSRTLKNNLKISCFCNFNELKPVEINKNSKKKCWFECDVCEHKFEKSVQKLALCNRWCPYCANQKLCKKEDCKICFEKSLASFEDKTAKGKYKKDCLNEELLTPRDIFKCSNKKYNFECDDCKNNFISCLGGVTGKERTWCPLCKNKTESKFKHYIHGKYPQYKLKYQPRYEWCRGGKINRTLPFDFAIEELKIIIEIDGRQHFEQVKNWQTPEHNLERDLYKMKKAKENSYTIIRIIQEDIYLDNNNWQEKLDANLKKYDIPQVICIGCPLKYSNHLD